MIEELQKIVNSNNPRSLGIIIKGNKPLKVFIDNFKNQNNVIDTGEAIFCLYHDQKPELCLCGNRKRFFNFIKGYWATCGSMTCSNQIRSKNEKKYFREHPEIMKKANIKTQQTMLSKYKTPNCSTLSWVKNKKKTTSIKNCGYEYFIQSPEGKNKIEQSCLEIYKVKNPQQNKQVHEKTKQTCLAKYGTSYACQSKSAKEKMQQTILERYNVEFVSQKHILPESLEILSNKTLFELALCNTTVKILAAKLGINPSTIYDYIKLHNIKYSNPNFSSYEQDISLWLTNNSIQFESNTKNIISPFEIDLYIPKSKIAIEFNGLYWHSEKGGKNKFYHLNKTNKCQEKGIRLIHIFEDEWLTKKEICLDLLKRFLNLKLNTLMARKCTIKQVSPKIAKLFLNENHLQGFASASIYLGLHYKDELVQLLTFRHARYNKNIEWENIRCCNKIGIKIVGGVQKLWHHFINTYNPLSVVSYCDKRWFLGETYKNLGFSFNKENKPQYTYTDHQTRWHRSLFTKKKSIKKALSLTTFSEKSLSNMTEKQIVMSVLNLDRIWDCGQVTWIWRK